MTVKSSEKVAKGVLDQAAGDRIEAGLTRRYEVLLDGYASCTARMQNEIDALSKRIEICESRWVALGHPA